MKQGQVENKGSWHQHSLPALHAPCCYASIYQAALLLFRLHTAHTHTIQIRSSGVQDIEGCSGDMMTFSIVAGHFEPVVNPSQRTGVIGDFLKPVQSSSDLPPDYCNVCTLHLFICVLLRFHLYFFDSALFFWDLLWIFKTSVSQKKTKNM